MPEEIDKKVKRAHTTHEIGSPYGASYFYGKVADEEYLSALKFPIGARTYDRMRRSDPQVSAVLNAIYSPIRSANWAVEPASESAKDKEIAKFIEKNLFPTKERMKEGPDYNKTWAETLREILLYIPFGFSVMEKVHVFSDGQIWLKKLSPRLPKTIKEFEFKSNEFSMVVQSVNGSEKRIPASKTVVFSANREGANIFGISFLRPVYKAWSIKEDLQRIQAATFERYGLGTPHGTLPPNVSETDKEGIALIAALEDLSSNEASYLVTPAETEVEIISGGAQTVPDMQKAIDYCDQQITISFLAQFLNLGVSSFGSRALGNTFVDFFTNTLEGIGDYIANKLNQQVIQELVDFNFNVDKYPKLVMSRMDSVDMDNLAILLDAGAITATLDLENIVRKRFRLAPISKEEWNARHPVMKEEDNSNENPDSSGKDKRGNNPEGKGTNKSTVNKKDAKKSLTDLIMKILRKRSRHGV